MLSSFTAIFFLLTLRVSCAHFKISEVESVVDDVLHGNGKTMHHISTQANDTLISELTATPWWYETISHQGISAFGPAGYQVFRNVKDFGARGNLGIFNIYQP